MHTYYMQKYMHMFIHIHIHKYTHIHIIYIYVYTKGAQTKTFTSFRRSWSLRENDE